MPPFSTSSMRLRGSFVKKWAALLADPHRGDADAHRFAARDAVQRPPPLVAVTLVGAFGVVGRVDLERQHAETCLLHLAREEEDGPDKTRRRHVPVDADAADAMQERSRPDEI